MELEMAGKKENKALQRQEALFKMKDAKITPSRKELRPKIAAMLNAKEDLVVINKVGHSFGSREALIEVNVYENQAALKKFESKHLIERDSGKKKEKTAKGKAKPVEKKEAGKAGPEAKPEAKKEEEKPEESDKGKPKEAKGEGKPEEADKEKGKPAEAKGEGDK